MTIEFGPGMAPTPQQLERLQSALRKSNATSEEEEHDDWAAREGMPAEKEFIPPQPKGSMLNAPPLHKEVTQIMWSVHWQYQKRILDHVQAASSSDRQWLILRRIMMEIMTEQLEKMQALVGQRIRQETYKKDERDEQRFGQPVEPGRIS